MVYTRSGPMMYKAWVGATVLNKHMNHMKAANGAHLMLRGVGRLEDLFMGLLLGLARLAINRSRQRTAEGIIYADCLTLFHGSVQGWVSLDREHAASTSALDAFWE
eukprot:g29608.t1